MAVETIHAPDITSLRCYSGRGDRRRRRRGATMVEMAVMLSLFLSLVFGLLDLATGVFRYHVLAQAARQGVRQAIVHGSLATRLGKWGPSDFSGTGESSDPLVKAIQPTLSGVDLSTVTIQARWLDGGNDATVGNRVQVTVSAPFRPIMTYIFGNRTYTLHATSTMSIAH